MFEDVVNDGPPVRGAPGIHGGHRAAVPRKMNVPLYRYKTKDGISDPVDIVALQALAASGRLAPYDHVTRDGHADWYHASTFISSFPSPSASAVPPPSPARQVDSRRAKIAGSRLSFSDIPILRFLTPAIGLAIAGFAGWYAFDTYSGFHFRSILGGQDVSSVLAIERSAHWIDWYLPRTPSLLRKIPSLIARVDGRTDGRWHYEVKTKTGEVIAFEHLAEGGDRPTQSLSTLWTRAMHARGYSRSDWKDRPNAILVDHLVIRDPIGTTWTVGGPGGQSDAGQMLCLAGMLGSSNYSGDVCVLTECDRGTFPYAFAFATITCKLSVDDALSLSCDADSRKRIFAAEMLLSTLPPITADSGSEAFDAAAYEATLEALSEPMSIADKRLRYERLRK